MSRNNCRKIAYGYIYGLHDFTSGGECKRCHATDRGLNKVGHCKPCQEELDRKAGVDMGAEMNSRLPADCPAILMLATGFTVHRSAGHHAGKHSWTTSVS
jgi:hypothetical protein